MQMTRFWIKNLVCVGKTRPEMEEEVAFIKNAYLKLCLQSKELTGSPRIYAQIVGCFKNRLYSELLRDM